MLEILSVYFSILESMERKVRKTKLKRIIEFILFLPAIMLMCTIFYFSSQPGDESSDRSSQASYEIVDSKYNLMNMDVAEWRKWKEASEINLYVRKAAHMSEYAVLFIMIYAPLILVYNNKHKNQMLASFSLCVLYAISDEIHQYFVPGRTSTPVDVIIDSVGTILGLFFVCFLCRFIEKYKKSAGHNIS